MAAGQGVVGDTAPGVVVLDDSDPRTPPGSATFESVNFSVEDPAVANVNQSFEKPLECVVTLKAPGATRVLCVVDPGAGEHLNFAVAIEARAPEPGEATSGTFELGEFVEQTAEPG